MKLATLLNLPAQLARQQREIQRLQKELDQLRAQNESMRSGMRRCLTCDYRTDYRSRMGGADEPDVEQP